MHQWPPRHPRAVCNPMPNPGRVRTSAGAPLPSASRALRSFASLARSYSPRACAHRPTRLAAGWSSTTSPFLPTPSTTALRAAALTDLRPRRPRPRRRPRRPPPCARGCRCHCRPDRPRRRCRRPRRRCPRRRRPPPLPPPPPDEGALLPSMPPPSLPPSPPPPPPQSPLPLQRQHSRHRTANAFIATRIASFLAAAVAVALFCAWLWCCWSRFPFAGALSCFCMCSFVVCVLFIDCERLHGGC